MGILNIAENEDAIIEIVESSNNFNTIQSIGRKDKPAIIQYPAAFVYWLGDKSVQKIPRPINKRVFHVLIYVRNLRSEEAAAEDAYSLIDRLYDDLVDASIADNLENLSCDSIGLFSYEDGIISYLMQFSAEYYVNKHTGV